MARPVKKGLDYFPMDINFFDDIKIRKLIKYQGGKATAVYTLLLCSIYQSGYYIKWDQELPFTISEKTGFEEGYVNEVIKSCLSIGLFSKSLFDRGVLTSKGIQDRYALICAQLKRRVDISEFTAVSSEETTINSEETLVNPEESTQRKGKEIKEKEKKGNLTRARVENGSEIISTESKIQNPPPFSARPPSFLAPSQAQCEEFFTSCGRTTQEGQRFFFKYQGRGWKDGSGNDVTDWAALAKSWILNSNNFNNGQSKRDQRREPSQEPYGKF